MFVSPTPSPGPSFPIRLSCSVGGTKICPANSSETIYPCTKTGRCVFNAIRRATQCKCPNGLQGKRCRQGWSENNSWSIRSYHFPSTLTSISLPTFPVQRPNNGEIIIELCIFVECFSIAKLMQRCSCVCMNTLSTCHRAFPIRLLVIIIYSGLCTFVWCVVCRY